MEAASLQFLAFGVVAAIGYSLLRPVAWRQGVLLVANFVFLFSFASKPWRLIPFAGFLLFGYGGVWLMQRGFQKAFAPFVLTVIALLFERKFAEIAARHDIVNIDSDSEFSRWPNATNLFYPVNGHLTEEGNAVFEQALVRSLLSSDLAIFNGCSLAHGSPR